MNPFQRKASNVMRFWQCFAAAALWIAASCTTDPYLRLQYEKGQSDAEADFESGTVELPIGCGTIAPGPDSSVREELGEREYRNGYHDKISELRGPEPHGD